MQHLRAEVVLIRVVILDIDGTLMDTNYLHIEAWEQAFEEVGERHPRSRIHHQVGKGSDKLIPEFVKDGEAGERVSELHGEFYAHMQELEAEGKVAGVVSSEEVQETKPAPDIFELALKRAESAAEEAVAVGDSVWDVESAREAGVRTVAVMTGGAFSRAEPEEAGAFAVYEDCAELLEAGFPEELEPSA